MAREKFQTLTEQMFYILLCLRQECCGTDIMARVQEELRGVKVPFKVAVMGCVVNGPGEAREADIGICGGGNGAGKVNTFRYAADRSMARRLELARIGLRQTMDFIKFGRTRLNR